MIDFNDKKYKPNLLSRLGFFISIVGVLYESKGLKEACKSIISMIKINFYKWRYKHCRKYREKVYNNAKKQGSMFPILLEMFIYDRIPSLDEIYERLDDEERVKFDESFKKNIEKNKI